MTFENNVKTGLLWSALERVGTQGIEFVIRIILARILFPDDFGTLAIVIGFLEISLVFVQSGFAAALIQAKEVDIKDISTVFYFNLFIAVIFCVGLCLGAPWIADFFEKPILQSIIPVLSFGLIISAFGQTQFSMLIRELEFKRILRITIPSTVISGVAGITFALTGFGLWALVFQRLIRLSILNAMYWKVSKWRPQLLFSFESLKRLFGFGSYLLGSGIIRRTVNNLSIFVLGKVFSTHELGFYQRATSFQKVPTIALHRILNRVLFPSFSKIQDDKPKLLEALNKGFPMIGFMVFPLMMLLIVAAEPLIISLLTEKWRGSIPYLRLLPVIGMLYPLHAVNISLLNAIGRSDVVFWTAIGKNTIRVIGIFVGIQFGIIGLIVAQIINSFVNFFVNAWFSGRYVGFGIKQQLSGLIPYVLASATAGGIAFLPTLSYQSIEGGFSGVKDWLFVQLLGLQSGQVFDIANWLFDTPTCAYLSVLVAQILILGICYFLICRQCNFPAMQRAETWITRFRKRRKNRKSAAAAT